MSPVTGQAIGIKRTWPVDSAKRPSHISCIGKLLQGQGNFQKFAPDSQVQP
jgi:hypothetical protein